MKKSSFKKLMYGKRPLAFVLFGVILALVLIFLQEQIDNLLFVAGIVVCGLLVLFGVGLFIARIFVAVAGATKKVFGFGKVKGKKIKKSNKPKETTATTDDDDIITLTNDAGKEVSFLEIAGIAHKGNFYAILQPVELLEGMDEDEALVFKVGRNPDGSDNFEIELNDAIIDAVFAEYNRLLDEAKNKN